MAARRMDRRRRARHRHARRRPAPLRRVHQQALHRAKNEETYRNVFTVHYPGRGARRRAARQDEPGLREAEPDGRRAGASATAGSAPTGSRRRESSRKDAWSFRRTNYFEHVGNECRLMRERVGVIDLTPFTKHEVDGPGRRGVARRLVANKVPAKLGRIALVPRAHEARRHPFRVHDHASSPTSISTSSAPAPASATTAITCTMLPADGWFGHAPQRHRSRGTFVVAGPKARDVLARADRRAARQRVASRGSPARHRSRASPPTSMRCASISSASSAGSCISRSNMRTACSRRSSPPARNSASAWSACARWSRCASRSRTGCGAPTSRATTRRSRRASTASCAWRRANSSARRRSRDNWRPACRIASSRSKSTASPTPIRSATSRCSTARQLVGRATAGYYGHVLGKSLALAYVKPGVREVGATGHRDPGRAQACHGARRIAVRSGEPGVEGLMQKFSAWRLLREAFSGQQGWIPQWRRAAPQPEYDAIVIGGGGHGLGGRVLPGRRTRHHADRGTRKRLDWRRQHRSQHDHHPLQLPFRRERTAVRPCRENVGAPVAGTELQRHVLASWRDDAGAHRA